MTGTIEPRALDVESRALGTPARTHASRRRTILLTVGVLGLLAGCTSAPAPVPSAPPSSQVPSSPVTQPTALPTTQASPAAIHPAGEPTALVTDLDAPWDIAFFGATALISERDTATISEVADDGTTRVVGFVAGVVHGGEGGLLGLAAHPGESALFVYSTGENGNRVERYQLTGAAGSLSLGEVTTIIDGIPSARNHNGGRLAIAPDGHLYIATGDGSATATAQQLTSLGGKILRVTTTGAIPADNPFAGSPVYSLGHRNVQGLGWAVDGTMFASEFGQDTWDELNIITPGGNYGWPEYEGMSGATGVIDPVQVWATDDASPSGLAVVGGTIFIANLRGRVLYEVAVSDPGTAIAHFDGVYGRLRDAELAPDGSLWILTNNTDGRGDPTAGDDRVLRVELTSD